MRSLDFDILTKLIATSIQDRSEFLNCVNIKKGALNLLVAPSQNDKIILINVLKILLDTLTDYRPKNTFRIIDKVIDVYNKTDLEYTFLNDINFYNILTGELEVKYVNELNIFHEKTTAKFIDAIQNNKTVSEDDFYLFKIQMFMYASVWFDMDKYLEYLYYNYLT